MFASILEENTAFFTTDIKLESETSLQIFEVTFYSH
jgi:hypothetical protein